MKKASQFLMQQYVNVEPYKTEFSNFLKKCLHIKEDLVTWTSPLPPEYGEHSGGGLFEALKIEDETGEIYEEFGRFWPKSGAHWDATAVSGNYKLMFEAKSHINETVWYKEGADPENSYKADSSLCKTYLLFGSKHSFVDWRTSFYQYANRLAHLYFLRSRGYQDAYMIFVYFANNPHWKENCNSVEEWKGAIQLQHHLMGLGHSELKKNGVLSIIVDCGSNFASEKHFLCLDV